ncbi:MAG TPA: sirohydrochlorin nickelochelatase [Methanocorpusculum sp.]|jgi:sirohydrochlorin cobaltochelatase|nr:sirohydrochlorin nickelochelatase [Methanocorpusculum sp.]HJJ62140.1 sirohydrochlorin nickelochelatase [Methanocorpusculum sp.]HJJ67951.1 sirohydrochlorin nickelochelatase [Methanocorpusculum sp.]HJJ70973.1 sirohydrochlorin nickelochelatase [Methanocorpusculum sp.]HJJ72928.1 sirohydrochlorin nickelochelatase [Methanocorpusculum sp.]
MTKHGLLIIGHGSRLEYGKELINETAKMIAEKTDEYTIITCSMEFNEPSVEEGLAEMRKKDIDYLVAIPMFLAKGIHVLHDIPEILGLSEGEFRGEFTLEDGRNIPLIYANPLGSDPLLANLMLKNAEAAVTQHL